MTRVSLSLALLLSAGFPAAYAQSADETRPAVASSTQCDRLHAEVAIAEQTKRAAVQKQDTAWKAVIPFAVIAQHSSATAKVADADKRLNDLNAELTRQGCHGKDAT
jgi:hypothetical protein